MKILSILLSFILLLNISQQREDSDHRDGREYDPTSKNEEIQIEVQTNTTFNNTPTNKTVVVKAPLPTILPEAKIILPIRRIGTSLSDFDIGPCGGIQKLKADTLTNKGSHINFVWETVTPAKNGNCTVRISPGMENLESFKTLMPTSGTHNKDGSFSCGAEKGFDSKEFKLPDDYECDGCILQFEWTTPYGNYYSCSDIIINGELMSTCLSKCQNGGTCFNGKCICVKGFSGEFCEDEDGKKINWLVILVILLGICLVPLIIYVGQKIYKWCLVKFSKPSKSWTHNQRNPSKPPFTGQRYYVEGSQMQE